MQCPKKPNSLEERANSWGSGLTTLKSALHVGRSIGLVSHLCARLPLLGAFPRSALAVLLAIPHAMLLQIRYSFLLFQVVHCS